MRKILVVLGLAGAGTIAGANTAELPLPNKWKFPQDNDLGAHPAVYYYGVNKKAIVAPNTYQYWYKVVFKTPQTAAEGTYDIIEILVQVRCADETHSDHVFRVLRDIKLTSDGKIVSTSLPNDELAHFNWGHASADADAAMFVGQEAIEVCPGDE